MNRNDYSKEFNEWATRYPIDPKDLESHWMAWNACRLQSLKILEKHTKVIHIEDEFSFERDEDIIGPDCIDMDAVKDIEKL